jgi:hypothetical protein
VRRSFEVGLGSFGWSRLDKAHRASFGTAVVAGSGMIWWDMVRLGTAVKAVWGIIRRGMVWQLGHDAV